MIINGDWSWADYLETPGHRRGGGRAAGRQRDRPADAADGRAQGLFAERQYAAGERPTTRWRSCGT